MLHNSYWLCCNLQLLNSVIINKAKVLLPHAYVTVTIADLDCACLWFYYPQNFKLFDFPIFRFKRTRWRFSQKHVRTKFDIYVLIIVLIVFSYYTTFKRICDFRPYCPIFTSFEYIWWVPLIILKLLIFYIRSTPRGNPKVWNEGIGLSLYILPERTCVFVLDESNTLFFPYRPAAELWKMKFNTPIKHTPILYINVRRKMGNFKLMMP